MSGNASSLSVCVISLNPHRPVHLLLPLVRTCMPRWEDWPDCSSDAGQGSAHENHGLVFASFHQEVIERILRLSSLSLLLSPLPHLLKSVSLLYLLSPSLFPFCLLSPPFLLSSFPLSPKLILRPVGFEPTPAHSAEDTQSGLAYLEGVVPSEHQEDLRGCPARYLATAQALAIVEVVECITPGADLKANGGSQSEEPFASSLLCPCRQRAEREIGQVKPLH
jgi:hypothetical protein